ncbi:MAG TPA: UbiA family prenyltransferase [Spirochaetota bacterium]|nr:UbiA family prenyltransferase [Spirochaetota bacterium]
MMAHILSGKLRKIIDFGYYYIKSMRLYYSFVTGISGWIGLEFYQHIASDYATVEVLTPTIKKIVIVIMLFGAWGINQIVNDFLGMKEDRINAPNRPMISGKLNPFFAVLVSAIIMTAMGVVTLLYLEPVALIPLFTGCILNILYEYMKAYGIWGNIVFGLMITQCTIFGFFASGPVGVVATKSRVSILLLLWIMNGIMTFYTYFKDYEGDKKNKIETLVVKFDIKGARIIAFILSFVPILVFLFIYINDFVVARVNNVFIFLALVTLMLQVHNGYLFYKYPKGDKTYYSLSNNFRAYVCAQAALISLFNKEMSLMLYIISYILIGFFFDLYKDTLC